MYFVQGSEVGVPAKKPRMAQADEQNARRPRMAQVDEHNAKKPRMAQADEYTSIASPQSTGKYSCLSHNI